MKLRETFIHIPQCSNVYLFVKQSRLQKNNKTQKR